MNGKQLRGVPYPTLLEGTACKNRDFPAKLKVAVSRISNVIPFPEPGSESSHPRLGRYELLGQLAQGGMAEIHLARAQGLEGFEKLVVIKKILPQLSVNRDFVQMFLDEARIAASLHHSNIAQVYEIGEENGSYFFVMEFLHGEDVGKMLRACRNNDRPLPQEHALLIAASTCAGLHYAHQKSSLDGRQLNIVHRDVSPQNVFVTYDGGVKVVDFGIAKAAHRASSTRLGTLKGKLAYMSPEQARQDPIDRRSDVFAVAIMLWEMTVGRRLFSGKSDYEILKKIVEADIPPPSVYAPEYSKELESIVMKGLRPDRDKRFQSAQEFQEAIEGYAREQRLATSAVGLEKFMRSLFAKRLEAWQGAYGQGTAVLARHLAQMADTEKLQISESRRGLASTSEASISQQTVLDGGRGNNLVEAQDTIHGTVSLKRDLTPWYFRRMAVWGFIFAFVSTMAATVWWWSQTTLSKITPPPVIQTKAPAPAAMPESNGTVENPMPPIGNIAPKAEIEAANAKPSADAVNAKSTAQASQSSARIKKGTVKKAHRHDGVKGSTVEELDDFLAP